MKQTVGYTRLITTDGRVIEEITLPPNGYCPVMMNNPETSLAEVVGIAHLTFKEMTGTIGRYRAVIADLDVASALVDLTASMTLKDIIEEPCPEGHSHCRGTLISLSLSNEPNAWGEKA